MSLGFAGDLKFTEKAVIGRKRGVIANMLKPNIVPHPIRILCALLLAPACVAAWIPS